MQIALKLSEHEPKDVVDALDLLEQALESDLFMECFPLILTDNGHEFADIEGILSPCWSINVSVTARSLSRLTGHIRAARPAISAAISTKTLSCLTELTYVLNAAISLTATGRQP